MNLSLLTSTYRLNRVLSEGERDSLLSLKFFVMGYYYDPVLNNEEGNKVEINYVRRKNQISYMNSFLPRISSCYDEKNGNPDYTVRVENNKFIKSFRIVATLFAAILGLIMIIQGIRESSLPVLELIFIILFILLLALVPYVFLRISSKKIDSQIRALLEKCDIEYMEAS